MTDPLVGTAVAQYEILAKLGGGGMGVVYTARDIRLGRLVALKFLPPQWSHDESAKQRFMREAQAASATDHRNICIIHNIEHDRRRPAVHRHGVLRGRDAEAAARGAAPLPIDEADRDRGAGGRGAGQGARAGRRAPRHQAGQPDGDRRWRQDPRLRPGEVRRRAAADDARARRSAPPPTCRRSRRAARRPTRAATSGRSASCCTRCWPARCRSAAPMRRRLSHAIRNEIAVAADRCAPDVPEVARATRIFERRSHKDRRFAIRARAIWRARCGLLQGRTMVQDLLTEPLPEQRRTAVAFPPRLRCGGAGGEPPRLVAAPAAIAAGPTSLLTGSVERVPVAVAPVVNQTGYAELDSLSTGAHAGPRVRTGGVTKHPRAALHEVASDHPAISRRSTDMSSREATQAVTTNSGAGIGRRAHAAVRKRCVARHAQRSRTPRLAPMRPSTTPSRSRRRCPKTPLRADRAARAAGSSSTSLPTDLARRPRRASHRSHVGARSDGVESTFEGRERVRGDWNTPTSRRSVCGAVGRTAQSVAPRVAQPRLPNLRDGPAASDAAERASGLMTEETPRSGCTVRRGRAGRSTSRRCSGGGALPGPDDRVSRRAGGSWSSARSRTGRARTPQRSPHSSRR